MKKPNAVLNTIANLNLEPIKNKLMDPEHGEGWSRAKVEAMDLEYRRFLHLMHTFPNQSASPTKAVDTFWHYHILDTQRYAADCDAVFGCFMHHNPNIAESATAETSDGDLMQHLYEITFGEAYIRPEAYYTEEADSETTARSFQSGAPVGQAGGARAARCQTFCGMQNKNAGAKASRCQTFCGMQAENTGTQAARCQTFCGMQGATAGTKAARCQTFCGMQAKTGATKAARCQTFCGMQAKTAETKAARCQTFCGMQAKTDETKAARCQTFCGMQAKTAESKAARCQTFCGMQANATETKAARCQTFCGMQAQPAGVKAADSAPLCGLQARPTVRNAERIALSI